MGISQPIVRARKRLNDPHEHRLTLTLQSIKQHIMHTMVVFHMFEHEYASNSFQYQILKTI